MERLNEAIYEMMQKVGNRSHLFSSVLTQVANRVLPSTIAKACHPGGSAGCWHTCSLFGACTGCRYNPGVGHNQNAKWSKAQLTYGYFGVCSGTCWESCADSYDICDDAQFAGNC